MRIGQFHEYEDFIEQTTLGNIESQVDRLNTKLMETVNTRFTEGEEFEVYLDLMKQWAHNSKQS
jgi:hypothetical protein